MILAELMQRKTAGFAALTTDLSITTHMDVPVPRAVQGRTNVAERMDARERPGHGWPGAARERVLSCNFLF
jgi:hypothetical protein